MSRHERNIIASALLDPDRALYLCAKEGIGTQHFTDKLLPVWEAILELAAGGKNIHIETVCEQMGKLDDNKYSKAMRRMVDECPSAYVAEEAVDGLKDDYLKRKLSTHLSSATEALTSQKGVDVMESLQTQLAGLGEHGGFEVRRLGDYAESVNERWTCAKTSGVVGVPCSLAGVNRYLGGWRPGVMGIIAGYRGEGKSTLIRQDACWQAKEGAAAALLSLEDPGDIAASRIVCASARTSAFSLDVGKCADSVQVRTMQEWSEIGDLPLYIVDVPLNMGQIEQVLTMLVARHGIKIAYVDHIQFISPYTLPHKSRNDTVATYSARMVALAKRLNIPIVCASQLSRDCEKQGRKPRLSDLRDSGTIEQDSRQILLLYWEGEQDCHIIEVAKNNYGVSGKEVEVDRISDEQRFAERETATTWEP